MSKVDSIIQRFTAELRDAVAEEVRDNLLAAIGGTAPTPKAAPPSRYSVAMPKPTPKRDSVALGEQGAEIEGVLIRARGNGMRIEQIAGALRVPTKLLVLPLKRLLASKRVTKTGEKRATTYSIAGGS